MVRDGERKRGRWRLNTSTQGLEGSEHIFWFVFFSKEKITAAMSVFPMNLQLQA